MRQALRRQKKNEEAEQEIYRPSDIAKALEPEMFLYQFQVNRRDDEIQSFAKESKSTVVEKRFNQGNSVFRLWIPDDPIKLQKSADFEFECWKVGPKMIKSE